jgi:23S rRNA (cytosine1962-C5)-methyltransferase
VGQDHLTLFPRGWVDYELADSGHGLKLERFGPYCLIRPEARAAWHPSLPKKVWEDARAVFEGPRSHDGSGWRFRAPLEPRWEISYRNLRFWVRPSPSGHIGVFPEQSCHWDWMVELIERAGRPVRVLNLFGYTGLATLAAASAGASLVHIDASRKTVAWARENAALSGLQDSPIRWIVDDAPAFVRREARRGSRYDGFIVDPPPYGRGPAGETWRLERDLPILLGQCRGLLSERPLFTVVTAYATRAAPHWLHQALAAAFADAGGSMAGGELALLERSAGHPLPTAIFARWTAAS